MNAPLIASADQHDALDAFFQFLECGNTATGSNDLSIGLKAARALGPFIVGMNISYPQRTTHVTDTHVCLADLDATWLRFKECRDCSMLSRGRNDRVKNGIAESQAWGIFLGLAHRFLHQQSEAGVKEANL
jgi:hypothetical protein